MNTLRHEFPDAARRPLTDPAETRAPGSLRRSGSGRPIPAGIVRRLFPLLLGLVPSAMLVASADTVLGPWKPIFKGIDHATGTNTPANGGFTNDQVIQAIRVDLTDPDVRLFTTPRIDNYIAGFRETGGLTVSDFLLRHRLQVAINVNTFDPTQYYLPAGTPMDVGGLLVSEGTVVSTQDSPNHPSVIRFTADKDASILHTNWPAASNDGIHTAAAAEYPLVIQGVNIGRRYLNDNDRVHRTQPRTAFGLSQDRRTLYLLTIDGRQPGFSEGALDWETGEWMLLLGAWDAVNMDGGGSTTLVMESSTGQALELNHPSAVADSGRQRTIGAHFGIYAAPARGFINDVVAAPDDVTATLAWTTTDPATSQVAWGTNTRLESVTAETSSLATRHSVTLSGLTPSTTYYYSVRSRHGATLETSPTYTFITTNYVTTRQVFDVTHAWRFSTANLDGVPWTTREYDDTAWSGPGEGLLWIDVRPAGPNVNVQPKGAALPPDPANSGYPFITYYFRTHFTATSAGPGSTLRFSSWIDDGAVLYLNGREIHRLNMDEAPTPIDNRTLASGFSLGGDATAATDFEVTGDAAAALLPGDNVLAVEVHNYNALSPDTTFGLALVLTEPLILRPILEVSRANGLLSLGWARPGFVLQQAPAPTGPWSTVPGITTPPYTLPPEQPAAFYRLQRP